MVTSMVQTVVTDDEEGRIFCKHLEVELTLEDEDEEILDGEIFARRQGVCVCVCGWFGCKVSNVLGGCYGRFLVRCRQKQSVGDYWGK